MAYAVEQLKEIITEAKSAAYKAADKYFKDRLGGKDQFSCGFAWVSLYDFNGVPIKGNSKIGRMLKAAGVDQDYRRIFQIWNPSEFGCQNIDTLEAGSRAAATVFNKYGFTAYAGSRLD